MKHYNFKKRYSHIQLLFLIFLISIINNSCGQNSGRDKLTDKYYVAAYVWPSCHHDERFGDMLWPEGIGEWEVIKKGNPRFPGHYQPKVPLWGYELDNDPGVWERWIDVATDHGVNVFIFDWYWFDEGPFLESALNDGFLKASNNDKMEFYVMWANHDVRRNYWNVHEYGDDTSILWEGPVNLENFEKVADRVINQYFIKSNYFKIDGEPVFHVFSPDNLVRGLGGLDQTRDALEYFRERTREAGFPGLHIQFRPGGGMEPTLLGNVNSEGKNVNEIVDHLGINSITKYNWGHGEDYLRLGTETMEKRDRMDSVFDIPVFPNVSIGWDDTPRFPHKGKEHVTYYNKTPESFAAFLQKAKNYCDERPDQPNLITLFSWNEWVEGSYLLPCVKYGFQHLEAVRRVISENYDPYSN